MALSMAPLWLTVVGSEHLSKSVSQFSRSYSNLELVNISVLSCCSGYSQSFHSIVPSVCGISSAEFFPESTLRL